MPGFAKPPQLQSSQTTFGFSNAVTYDTGGFQAEAVVAADLDGDGKPCASLGDLVREYSVGPARVLQTQKAERKRSLGGPVSETLLSGVCSRGSCRRARTDL